MHVDWVTVLFSLTSGIVGGLIGAVTVGWKVGRWQAQIEGRLKTAEERLEKGDDPIDQIPVITGRLDTVIEEIRDMRKQMREDMQRLVSREECDRRHGK